MYVVGSHTLGKQHARIVVDDFWSNMMPNAIIARLVGVADISAILLTFALFI